jgi:nitrite reductase/ring-hydroxylating ferredoxin subunit
VAEHRAAAFADVVAGQPRLAEVGGVRVVLVRLGDAIHAFGDVCSHRGGSLSQGKLSGAKVACPLHGWLYDVRTGQCLFPPRGDAVPSYRVRIEGDNVLVDLPPPKAGASTEPSSDRSEN